MPVAIASGPAADLERWRIFPGGRHPVAISFAASRLTVCAGPGPTPQRLRYTPSIPHWFGVDGRRLAYFDREVLDPV